MNIAICAEAFGYGPASKAVAVARALQERGGANLAVWGEGVALEYFRANGLPQARDGHPSRNPPPAEEVRELGVAVVVLDADWVDHLAESDVPIVFVDSLGFLWDRSFFDSHPRLRSVAAYAAQDALGAAEELGCFGIRNLYAVGAVIASDTGSAGPGLRNSAPSITVQLGGLTTRHGHEDVDLYLRFVDRLVAEAAWPAPIGPGLCGAGGAAAGRGLHLPLRTLPQPEAMKCISGGGYVLTSPGLTSLLEFARLGVRVCPLPPQNYSQVLISRRMAALIGGPVWALLQEAYRSVPGGLPELAGLREVKRLNQRLLGSEEFRRHYGELVSEAAAFAPLDRRFYSRFDGAAQVAEMALAASRAGRNPSPGARREASE